MAGGFSAPGVYRRELDLSEILISQGVSNGATVIRAKKGPVRRPVLVSNDKNFIETFGEPYYASGLDDKHPVEAAIGGRLVPELGYGAYGAIEFLKESNTLYVVRAFSKDDKYSTVEVKNDAKKCSSCDTSAGIEVLGGPIEVFDTNDRIETYEEYYREGGITDASLLVGYVGPGKDGDNFAVTVETISPTSEWLYSYDEYPTQLSATQVEYGNDVPEVWIDGAQSNMHIASASIELDVVDGNFSPITPATSYEYTPIGVSDINDADEWSIYRGRLKEGDEKLLENMLTYTVQDGITITDFTTDVNIEEYLIGDYDPSNELSGSYATSGDWTISGTYTDSGTPTITGTFSASDDITSHPATDIMHGSAAQVKTHFPIANDIIKISVFKKPDDKEWDDLYVNADDRLATKLRMDPIEVFYGTMKPKQDADRNELFIEKSVNGNSAFIYVKSDGSFTTSASWKYDSGFISKSLDVPTGSDTAGAYVLNDDRLCTLSGGNAEITTGLDGRDSEFWQYFEDREELPVQIIINPSFNDIDKQAVGDLCNVRRDCIACNQVGSVKVLNALDIINTERYGYPAPSYISLYAGYSKVYDNYNDKFVYLPNNLFAAPIFARVDRITEPWFAPSGVSRATLSVLDQNKVFNMTSIGNMYDRNINSIKRVQGVGFVIWGQKTAQLKTSALNRINVRRNIIYIQNNIERSLNDYTFENNTTQTRLRVFSVVDEFLAGVRAGDGLYAYEVVVDESNNPPSVIDANQMNVDIYLQPVKTAEFIQFTSVITRTGASFSEARLKYA